MSGVVPASTTEVFRNERRERSSRVMTDRHFDFSIIEMIIPPKEGRSRGENSPEGGAIQVSDEAFPKKSQLY